ncbi:MAG: peptidase M52 hydrogen uptake protein [Chloroflexi bacterium]|nr:MAG: peptidase M52 hydrogen uptake protein [Chloroflexota bacterium]
MSDVVKVLIEDKDILISTIENLFLARDMAN